MTEIEDLKIRVERMEQEIAKMKEILSEYTDIEELTRKLDEHKKTQEFIGR